MAITKDEHKKIYFAAESVWQGIAADIPEVSVTTEEMLELSLDANRLELFGHPTEEKLWSALVNEVGYGEALKLVAVHSPYDAHEAGGAMAL